MLKRASSTTTARGRVGISGTRISRTFEGRCVNTMVLTRPKRAASREASNAETPANTLAQKKIMPSVARSEEHTSELQSQSNLVCRLLLEKKKKKKCQIDMQIEHAHSVYNSIATLER